MSHDLLRPVAEASRSSSISRSASTRAAMVTDLDIWSPLCSQCLHCITRLLKGQPLPSYRGTLAVEVEQPHQRVLLADVGGPAIGAGDRGVELAIRVVDARAGRRRTPPSPR